MVAKKIAVFVEYKYYIPISTKDIDIKDRSGAKIATLKDFKTTKSQALIGGRYYL